MKKEAAVLLGLVFVISSCAAIPPRRITLQSRFNPSDVSWFAKKGNNTLKGQAFLRTRGGEVRTCAGFNVHLIPVSKYAEERITKIYGSPEGGYLPYYSSNYVVTPDSQQYDATVKKTICNASGNFEFQNLPDGDYYVQTTVIWEAEAGIYEGGFLVKKVHLEGGKIKKIIITN